MMMTSASRVLVLLAWFFTIVAALGCGTTASETFYIGRFDPLNQLPQELYRFRVKGEGSWYHDIQFASGWLPAKVVDPLQTTIALQNKSVSVRDDRPNATGGNDEMEKTHVEAYRTMRLFGPEAFVEVPKELRFCVVMSSDPNKFFQAAKLLAGGSLADEAALLRLVDSYRLKGANESTQLDQTLTEIGK